MNFSRAFKKGRTHAYCLSGSSKSMVRTCRLATISSMSAMPSSKSMRCFSRVLLQ